MVPGWWTRFEDADWRAVASRAGIKAPDPAADAEGDHKMREAPEAKPAPEAAQPAPAPAAAAAVAQPAAASAAASAAATCLLAQWMVIVQRWYSDSAAMVQ